MKRTAPNKRLSAFEILAARKPGDDATASSIRKRMESRTLLAICVISVNGNYFRALELV
ncbi:MAG: hypothetical protein ACYDCD_08815 [Candidatus Acidiferrales bacterium]